MIQNQQVAVSFTILEDGITIVHKELHVLGTDTNELIITNIREGVITLGDFETIDWSNAQFLQVELDTDSGNVD